MYSAPHNRVLQCHQPSNGVPLSLRLIKRCTPYIQCIVPRILECCSFISLAMVCLYPCSYVMRLIKKCQHKDEEPDDVYARWEKDFDLIPLSVHGLFYEYLELSKYRTRGFALIYFSC